MQYTKWGGGKHWYVPSTYLGADEHGHWVGAGAGTVIERPGRRVAVQRSFVGLFPYDGWFTPTYYESTEPAIEPHTYVDISTVPIWQRTLGGLVVTMVDVDLDVIRFWDGTVIVDDEDEFAEHQVSLAYPPDLVAAAERSCRAVERAVGASQGPFGGTADAWLARLERLIGRATA